jgi:hypothetical protein
MTTTSIVMGHDEQERVQEEQVEDHGGNGQVAAAGREFGDPYEADV